MAPVAALPGAIRDGSCTRPSRPGCQRSHGRLLLARFGVFDAGMASARDPKYTVVPQRERMAARETQHSATVTR